MSDNDFTPYPEAKPNPSFPKMEEAILNFWEEKEIFKKSISNRDGNKEFVFYDGPPFANGLPHYGHLVTSYIKDVVPRYQTMKAKKLSAASVGTAMAYPLNFKQKKSWRFLAATKFSNTAWINSMMRVKNPCSALPKNGKAM